MLIVALISTPLFGQVDAVQQTEEMEKIDYYVCKAVEATDNDSCWLAASYIIDSLVYGLPPEDNTWEETHFDDVDHIFEHCGVYIEICFAETRLKMHLMINNLMEAKIALDQAGYLMKANGIEIPARFNEYKKQLISKALEPTY